MCECEYLCLGDFWVIGLTFKGANQKNVIGLFMLGCITLQSPYPPWLFGKSEKYLILMRKR